MPTSKKIEQVENLKDKINRCIITVATDYTGLGVNSMTELRQKMREKEIEFRVVKNTLTYLAADSAQVPQFKEIVQGPTALAFGYKDPVEVAKALEEYIRVNRSPLSIRGAFFEGRPLTAAQVTSLANLPPRAELLAKLMGQVQLPAVALLSQLQAPMSRLLGTLNAPLSSLANLLQQRAEQLRSQQT